MDSRLLGIFDISSPTRTRSADVPLAMLQLCRIQSIGLVEPWRSHSSVTENAAAVSEKSSSRESITWQSWISPTARCSGSRSALGRRQNRPTEVARSLNSGLSDADPPTPTITDKYTNICSICQDTNPEPRVGPISPKD